MLIFVIRLGCRFLGQLFLDLRLNLSRIYVVVLDCILEIAFVVTKSVLFS